MTNEELGHLFGLFRHWILADLSAQGYPTSFVGSILNWFNPTTESYLQHVDEWKQLLARGAAYLSDVPRSLVDNKVASVTPYHTVILNEDAANAVRQVHAIASLFYKSHCPARRETDWDDVKRRLSAPPELSLTQRDMRRLRAAVERLDVCPDVDGLGSYGPGITADGFSPFDRWNREGWIPPVPPNWYRWSARDRYEPRVNFGMRITRIAEVPKSLKSNRVISSEPAQSMFAQKCVWGYLDRALMRYFNKYVSLHDQERHNTLLDDPDYRTIDLSDASDYVRCDLVRMLLPTLWPLLASVRSTHACFPDGELVELSTFAPMGSGVCFPILTIVNLAIGLAVCKHPFSVYGDDGIFHKDDILAVTEMQIACGLKVNQGKTCYLGTFRESCGKELFGSTDITPVYIRDPIPFTDWSKLNEMLEKFERLGWFSSAEGVVRLVAKAFPPRYRVNPRYQRHEILVPVTIRCDREKHLDGYAGLRKWYLTRQPCHAEPESKVISVKGKVKRVCRYRALSDYPKLVEYLGMVST